MNSGVSEILGNRMFKVVINYLTYFRNWTQMKFKRTLSTKMKKPLI